MNFKPQGTTKADKLIMVGESIKMQEAAGLEPMCRIVGGEFRISDCLFDGAPTRYEFPVGICEGKRVWRGDELYGKAYGTMYKVCESGVARVSGVYTMCSDFDALTWTPPKPKTIDILSVDLKIAKMMRDELFENIHSKSSDEFCKALDAAIKKAEA